MIPLFLFAISETLAARDLNDRTPPATSADDSHKTGYGQSADAPLRLIV